MSKIYKLDEIELVGDDSPTEIQKEDLTDREENDVLFKTVMKNPPLKAAYYDSPSLENLKRMFDKLYIYTDEQREYLEVVFNFDLEDRFTNS